MREADGDAAQYDVESVEQVLESAPVTLAVLYGSRARGDATVASDLDIAVAYDDSLSSTDRTDARLALIERLSTALGEDDVDVVPLSEIPPELRREICTDGTVLVGSRAQLEAYCEDLPQPRSREDRLAEFDELLADLERVV